VFIIIKIILSKIIEIFAEKIIENLRFSKKHKKNKKNAR